MRFIETPLPGAWVIELELLGDERGWFARTFDAGGVRGARPEPGGRAVQRLLQRSAGTLRGMHYQAEPHGESKLVRCVRGAIFDVAVDLRAGLADLPRRWHGVELSAENGRAFYIPAGLAHGFQTLTDDCEVLYQMGHRYVPEAARGVRWDDPAFAIEWPGPRRADFLARAGAPPPDFRSWGDRRAAHCAGARPIRPSRVGDRNRGITARCASTIARCRSCRTTFLADVPADLDRYYPQDYYGLPSTPELERAANGEAPGWHCYDRSPPRGG